MSEKFFEEGKLPVTEGGEPIVAFLDMNDPEDKAIAEEIEEGEKETRESVRKNCPTPEDAIEPYRQGMISLHDLKLAFTQEEVDYILGECRKRNEAEK